MIANCTRCGAPYWSYRPPPIPRGYCTMPCYEARKARKPIASVARVEDPRLLVAEIRQHVAAAHRGEKWLVDECATCESLGARYAASLEGAAERWAAA